VMEALGDPPKRQALLEQVQSDAERELGRSSGVKQAPAPGLRSAVKPFPIRLPAGVAWGAHTVRSMPLEMVFQYLSKNELYRLSWGAKNTHGPEWERLQALFEARLERMQSEARLSNWLKPQAVYGYWPCQANADDLILYNPSTFGSPSTDVPSTEAIRLTFPRQPGGENLCLADYFAPLESGVFDVLALQVVTVGQEASQRFERLQADGDYSEAYYTHGLAVQTAEATAEYLHRHILRELGLPEAQGKRYSWGYPAIPELEQHRKVFDLLPAEAELGMSLTTAFQLVPEQSTAAIIVHHPQAKYYSVGESRVEQLMDRK
jgi:5-methyltetrahydrofolate--homocysteine methyltransferase